MSPATKQCNFVSKMFPRIPIRNFWHYGNFLRLCIQSVYLQVDSVRDRENELDGEDFLGKVDGEFDTNNSTHTTKVS